MAVTICLRSLATGCAGDDRDGVLVNRALQPVNVHVLFERCLGKIGIAVEKRVDGLPQRMLRQAAHLCDHRIQRLQFRVVNSHGMLVHGFFLP